MLLDVLNGPPTPVIVGGRGETSGLRLRAFLDNSFELVYKLFSLYIYHKTYL